MGKGNYSIMRDDPFSDDLLVHYLLGDLSEAEQAEVEDRAFQDQQYLRNIEAVESDLIDGYVRGELSERERQQFEARFFVSPERRRKVEFARALARVAPEFAVIETAARPSSDLPPVSWSSLVRAFLRSLSPSAKYALAAAALLIVIGGSWLIAESVRLRAQLVELRAGQQSREREQQTLQQQIADEQARREELSTQLQREREQREQNQQLIGELQRKLEESTAPPSPAAVISLALWPDISRGGGASPKLIIPAGARSVRLQIGVEPEDDYPGFRVELRAPGGQPIWTQANLSARRVRGGRAVILNLPAGIFKTGKYELALKGVTAAGTTEDVAYYYVDALKK
jgi:anti-sigma factor RsiW